MGWHAELLPLVEPHLLMAGVLLAVTVELVTELAEHLAGHDDYLTDAGYLFNNIYTGQKEIRHVLLFAWHDDSM